MWKVNKLIMSEIAVQIVSEIARSPRGTWHFSRNPKDKTDSATKTESWECVFEAGGRGCKDSEAQKSMTYSRSRLAFKEMGFWLESEEQLHIRLFQTESKSEENCWETKFLMCWGGVGKKETGTFFLETDSLRWRYSLADAGQSLSKENHTHCTKMQKC